jgi:hypothetical protein
MRGASSGDAMNAANSFVDKAPDLAGTVTTALPGAWERARQALTWRRWALATALGVLLGVLVPLQDLHINFYFTPWKIVNHTRFFVFFAWVFLLAIAGVEASVSRSGWPSLWRYFYGAVAASFVCLGLAWSFSDQIRIPERRVISGGSSNTQRTYAPRTKENVAVFLIGFDGVVYGWLATFIYAGLRNSRRATQALAEAEIERSEANRALVASQLEAAHAEIDPAVVFGALETIERTYEENPARADALLDELIAMLRAAIPRLRSDGPTPAIDGESTSRPR